MEDAEFELRLSGARAEFCAQMKAADACNAWANFGGRIAAVLSGGGARGAYQAGALLAFQDAAVPIQVLTASSVGAINAVGFAGTSNVGNAEPLVDAWRAVSNPQIGVEWARMNCFIAAMVIVTTGFADFVLEYLEQRGLMLHSPNALHIWIAVIVLGTVLGLLSPYLPYAVYVARDVIFRQRKWKFDTRRMVLSVGANLLVVLCTAALAYSMVRLANFFLYATAAVVALGITLLFVAALRWLGHRKHLSIGTVIGTGLFTNAARERFVRSWFTSSGGTKSPMRVVITVTDLQKGEPRFLCNTPTEILFGDPGISKRFARQLVYTDDLVTAAVTSSAVPVAFDPVRCGDAFLCDGGVCANNPIKPAIDLGADVIFVIMNTPAVADRTKLTTCADIGLRAFDIIANQRLEMDLLMLTRINQICAAVAADAGAANEQAEVMIGARRYRFISAFAISPIVPLPVSMLDFEHEKILDAIYRGYIDAGVQLCQFVEYARETTFRSQREKIVLRTSEVASPPS